jgi:hypothetical protein
LSLKPEHKSDGIHVTAFVLFANLRDSPALLGLPQVATYRLVENTMSDTASPLPRLNTADAAIYLLRRHGIRVAKSTLKQWAWRGGGPEFQKSGPHRLYPVARLDVWAEQRLTPVVASTSELTNLLTIGRDPVPELVQKPAQAALPAIGRQPVQEAVPVAARSKRDQVPVRSPPPPRSRTLAMSDALEEAPEDKPRR